MADHDRGGSERKRHQGCPAHWADETLGVVVQVEPRDSHQGSHTERRSAQRAGQVRIGRSHEECLLEAILFVSPWQRQGGPRRPVRLPEKLVSLSRPPGPTPGLPGYIVGLVHLLHIGQTVVSIARLRRNAG